MLLVPVKSLASAKQRLACVLDADERSALAAAMLEDVLETLAGWTNCPPVIVVTGDPWACSLAHNFSFEVMQDSANNSETDAVEMATRACEASGVNMTLVLPADVPLVQASELEQIQAAAPPQGTVLVPARNERGTNAALRRPAALFPLRFGDDSFHAHVAAATATGHLCVILRLSGIGLDVDQPADLFELVRRPGHSRAQVLLRQWKVAGRMIPAHTR